MGPRKFLKFLKPKVFGPVFDFDPYRVNYKILLFLGSNPGNPPKIHPRYDFGNFSICV